MKLWWNMSEDMKIVLCQFLREDLKFIIIGLVFMPIFYGEFAILCMECELTQRGRIRHKVWQIDMPLLY